MLEAKTNTPTNETGSSQQGAHDSEVKVKHLPCAGAQAVEQEALRRWCHPLLQWRGASG